MIKKDQSIFYSKLFLLLVFVVVQCFCWQKFGVSHHLDSANYLKYSQHLISEISFPFERLFWYTSYAFFLSIFQLLGLSLKWVILVQVIISGFASVAIYKITYTISNQNLSAFIATLLFICCVKIQWWNNYILTESLFISTNICLFYLLLKFRQVSWKIIALFPLLIFIFFLRPTGLITLVAFCLFLFHLLWTKYNMKLGNGFLFLPIGILLLLLSNKMLSNYNVIEAFQGGQLICGIPQNVHLETKLTIRTSYDSNLVQVLFLILENPIFFIKQSFNKMLLFWTAIRSDYSLKHNLFSIIFLLPSYFFALVAIWKKKINMEAGIYILSIISLTSFLVLITCVNWNSRFLAPALPYVFILSGIGFGTFYAQTD